MKIDFLRDEIRCGFYIPTAIKQAWAAQLAVLSELDKLCKKHGISYFAEYGTLLGAVRHKGYVPWDDDIDVGMKREDYIRFRQVAKTELPPGFALQDFRNQEDHWLFITRFVNKNRICFEEEHLNRYYNFPYIAGIDIFVMDYLYEDKEKERARDEEVKRILAVADGIVENNLQPDVARKELMQLEKRYDFQVPDTQERRRIGIALYELAERQMSRTKPEESDSIGQIYPWILKGRSGLPKSYYERFTYLPFETEKIPVPAAYQAILRERYGDYLVIKRGGATHDYPCFEGQKKNLEEAAGGKLPEYLFDRSALYDERSVTQADVDVSEKILFLAAGPQYWEGFSQLYRYFTEKDGISDKCSVSVVALPILYKDALGRTTSDSAAIDAAARIEQYPKDIPVMEWWEYEIRKEQPDLVFVQDPYDEENPCVTIPKEYYTRLLRRYAKRIVYIPPFGKVQDDFEKTDECSVYNLKHYALAPGCVYADLILVASATLRQRYLEALTAWAGEDTQAYWERKLRTAFDVAECETVSPDAICAFLPEQKKEADIDEKRKVLYLIGMNELCEDKGRFLASLGKRLQTIQEKADRIETTVCLYPEAEEWERLYGAQMQSVKALLAEKEQEGACRLLSYSAAGRNLSDYDAYYGSASPMVVSFCRMKKPVMIADYAITD